jgi:hypothetical protein
MLMDLFSGFTLAARFGDLTQIIWYAPTIDHQDELGTTL